MFSVAFQLFVRDRMRRADEIIALVDLVNMLCHGIPFNLIPDKFIRIHV